MGELLHAWRQLRRAPGFTLLALATLSLTVGLTAVAFSVFDALLLRPLPYAEPERLVQLEPRAAAGFTQPASWPEYLFWRDNNRAFAGLMGYSTQAMNFRGPSGPQPVSALHGTANFFNVLGVKPLLGRTFLPEENEHGKNNVAVLSYGGWQKLFSGRPDVVGRVVGLDGWPVTVIGVMPRGFRFPLQANVDVYMPFRLSGHEATDPNAADNHWMPTVARLKPGISLAAAEAESTRVLAAYARVEPNGAGRRMELTTLPEAVLGETRPMVEVLLASVLVLLALGCVNVAGLMLVRGLRRERELALRSALGASQGRLALSLVSELALLALGGTAGGVLLAHGLLGAVRALLGSSLSRGADVTLNPLVTAGSLLAALVTLLLAGALPLRQLRSVAPGLALRGGSQATGVGREAQRLGAVFLAAQMGLAMVLLVTGGLLLHALTRLRSTTLGFRPDHLLVEDVNLSPGSIVGRDLLPSFYAPVLERVRAIPGVSAAGIISLFPIQGWGWNGDVQIVGKPAPPPDREVLAEDRFVTGGYFAAMGMHALRGRLLEDNLDTAGGERVIVVNQAFVRKFFAPSEDPVGRRIAEWDKPRIVGVVADTRQRLYKPPLPEIDFPVAQLPAALQRDTLQEMQLVVRSTVDPRTLAEPLRRALASVDPTLPFRPVQTLDDVLDEQLVTERLQSWLFGSFAAVATLLAAVGLYGLVAQYVEHGRRAIGVRFALGAKRGDVLGELLRRVGAISGAGLLAGLLASYAARRVIGSLLSGGPGHEVGLVLGLVAGLEGLALLAAAGPAWRAARVNPVEVLRAQ